MEEHLTILPPPPPVWMTLRAALVALLGRVSLAVVRVVITIVRLARQRRVRPRVTLSAILDRIDGERGCVPREAELVGAGQDACRRTRVDASPTSSAAERPTRVEALRRRAPSMPESGRERRRARRSSRRSGSPGLDRPSRLPSARAR